MELNPINRIASWFSRRGKVAEFAGDGSSPLAMVATTPNGPVIGRPIGYSGSILDTVAMAPDAEVVSANGTWTGIGAMNMQVLANGVNTKGERFDATLIEAMLDDPLVRACVDTRKVAVLCGELRFHPSVEDADDSEPDPSKGDPAEAKWAADFCERAHANLDVPIPIWAWGFMDYQPYGHAVAEKVLEQVQDGPDAGLYTLKALKIKGRWAYHLCTDPYLNLVAVYAQTIWGPAYIDARHFFVMANQPRDADPRGTSILRAAKEPWRRKQRRLKSQTAGDDQFGMPSIVMELAPNTPIESQHKRRDGTPMTSIEFATSLLEQFKNGGAIAIPSGAKLYVIESGRDGAQLVQSINYDDREIVRGVLNTNGSGLLEPEHYTQGNGEHSQGKERGLADFDRDAFLAAVRRQVFHYMLEVNFGRPYADLYTPRITMGAMPMDEFLKLASPASVLGQAGLLTPSQIEYILLQGAVPRPKKGELRVGPAGPIPDELPDPATLAPKTPPAAEKEAA